MRKNDANIMEQQMMQHISKSYEKHYGKHDANIMKHYANIMKSLYANIMGNIMNTHVFLRT